MKILFFILPLLVSILIVITKSKIVKASSGEKYTIRELVLDIIKVTILAMIAIVANLVVGKDIPIWSLVIDAFMLIIYTRPLLQKNFDYADRKATMGIIGSCIFLTVMAITIFQMMIGVYDNSNSTLMHAFLKGVSYFFLGIFCCFTADKKGNKLKILLAGLKDSFETYQLDPLSYYTLAALGLFTLTGGNGSFVPVGLFGIHEILNKKYVKGIVYLLLSNVTAFLYRNTYIGSLAFVVFTAIAFIDLLIHFFASKKK